MGLVQRRVVDMEMDRVRSYMVRTVLILTRSASGMHRKHHAEPGLKSKAESARPTTSPWGPYLRANRMLDQIVRWISFQIDTRVCYNSYRDSKKCQWLSDIQGINIFA